MKNQKSRLIKSAICAMGIVVAVEFAAYGLNQLAFAVEDQSIEQKFPPIEIKEVTPAPVHVCENRNEIEMEDSAKVEIYLSLPKIENEIWESPIQLSDEDRWFIEAVVAGEAGGEPYEGKLAVAQCYFNAMLKDGLTAKQVKREYQYSGWNPYLENQNQDMWNDVCNAVYEVFDLGQFVTDKPILFFYAPQWCESRWHEAQEFEMEIEGHRFFYLAEDENAEWTNILLTNINEYGIIEP